MDILYLLLARQLNMKRARLLIACSAQFSRQMISLVLMAIYTESALPKFLTYFNQKLGSGLIYTCKIKSPMFDFFPMRLHIF